MPAHKQEQTLAARYQQTWHRLQKLIRLLKRLYPVFTSVKERELTSCYFYHILDLFNPILYEKIYYLPIDGLSSRKGTSVGAIYKTISVKKILQLFMENQRINFTKYTS